MSVKNPGDDEKVLEVNHRAARTLRVGDWDGFAQKITMTSWICDFNGRKCDY